MSEKKKLEEDTLQVLGAVISHLQKQQKTIHPYLLHQYAQLVDSCTNLAKRWSDQIFLNTNEDEGPKLRTERASMPQGKRPLRSELCDWGFGVSQNRKAKSERKSRNQISDYENVSFIDGIEQRKEDYVLKQMEFQSPLTPMPTFVVPPFEKKGELLTRGRTASRTTDDLPEYKNVWDLYQVPTPRNKIPQLNERKIKKSFSTIESSFTSNPLILTRDENISEDLFFIMLAETTFTKIQGWKSIGKYCALSSKKMYILSEKNATSADYSFPFMDFKIEMASFGKCLAFKNEGAEICVEFTTYETCKEWCQELQRLVESEKECTMMRDDKMRKYYNDAQTRLHFDAKESVKFQKKITWDPLNG